MAKRTGSVDLPLHGGKAPRWLFGRMVELSKGITAAVIKEYGQTEFLRRLSDPYWFQALSCVLGFDWHSSGTTTTTCGALKMAVKPEEFGIGIAGGKGKTSRKTPAQIDDISEKLSLSSGAAEDLRYSSRISAKVDNTCVQDGFQLYHHSFFFTEKGDWAVIQQGMDGSIARRYHWLSTDVSNFVEEPHSAICGDEERDRVLNMVSRRSREARKTGVDIVNDNPEHLRRHFRHSGQLYLDEFTSKASSKFGLPKHHPVLHIDISDSGWKTLKKAYEVQPKNYEELISLNGMGPKTIRALALISELIYGAGPSWKDPVKYSFAHGGKDGYPYPVDRETYDESMDVLKNAIQESGIRKHEMYKALKRLHSFV